MSSQFCAHAEEAALILANVDLNGTMGIAYIGGTISCMYAPPPFLRTSGVRSQRCSAADRIYGVTCIQTFHYFRSQQAKADAWYLRNIVSVMMLLSQSRAGVLTTGESGTRLGPFCNSESLSSFLDTPSHSFPSQVPGHGSPSYHHSSSLLLRYHELRQSLCASEGFMVRLHQNVRTITKMG